MTDTPKTAKPEPKTRKLVATVHVDGVAYGPGDVVPTDVAAKIANPKAWAAVESE